MENGPFPERVLGGRYVLDCLLEKGGMSHIYRAWDSVGDTYVAIKIADLVKEGKLGGIADIRDESSGRTGQRLVIVLKRDAVAKVVLNNLYKHTQLQDNFGANMLAIVDGVPRTLPIDGFITYWTAHQIEVIVRRTAFRLKKAEADAHILRGYLKALDALDEVIALIRRRDAH